MFLFFKVLHCTHACNTIPITLSSITMTRSCIILVSCDTPECKGIATILDYTESESKQGFQYAGLPSDWIYCPCCANDYCPDCKERTEPNCPNLSCFASLCGECKILTITNDMCSHCYRFICNPCALMPFKSYENGRHCRNMDHCTLASLS